MLRSKLGVLLAASAFGIFLSLLLGAPPGIVIAIAITPFVGYVAAKNAASPVIEMVTTKVAAAKKATALALIVTVLLLGSVLVALNQTGAPFEVGWLALGFIALGGSAVITARSSSRPSFRGLLGYFTGHPFAVPIG